MPTSNKQRNTTIDVNDYNWYKRIASPNPLLSMVAMRRQAHEIYQQNYALLGRAQRPLQDAGIYMSNSELIGFLLRLVIYKKIDLVSLVTVVNESEYCDLHQTPGTVQVKR